MNRTRKVSSALFLCAFLYLAAAAFMPHVSVALASVVALCSSLAILLIVYRRKKSQAIRRALAGAPSQGGVPIAHPATGPERVVDAIIQKYVAQVGSRRGRRLYEIQDLTCNCIRELHAKEVWCCGPAPNSGEYLYKWRQRANTDAVSLAGAIEARLRGREKELEEEQRARDIAEGEQLLAKWSDLVNKFLEIAERKVSILDDYGDERLHLLPKEVDECVLKIADREAFGSANIKENLKRGYTFMLPAPLQHLRSRLPELFADYHHKQRHRSRTRDELGSLSGIEFETYVARILRHNGWTVSATPTTGDQGADLIASKGGRKLILQAKRYDGSVGNHAVQEVVGALNFYGGTEGCVVTNSTFTAGARALAQKNNVRLIDGLDLRQLGTL